jgi:ATP-binding cassette subfamily B protein
MRVSGDMNMKNKNITIASFLWSILKPYKWHYVMMFQIPMVAVAFHVLNSYALKLIVDTGTSGKEVAKWDIIYPIVIFIGIATFQEIVCRAGQWAFNKSQPYIRGKIISKAYEYVQNHSYTFFQNTHSGSIASKIKGIVGGYDNVFEYIWFKLMNPFVMCIFGTLSLVFINLHLAILVLIWCIIFFIVGLKMSLKLSTLSTQSNDLKHKAVGFIADNITNIFTIFSFASKLAELKKIKDFTCGEVADLDYKKNLYQFKFACVGAGLFIGMSSSVLIYTAYLRYINQITVGDFAYIVTILYIIIHDIWSLSAAVGNFFDTLGDFKSSFSMLQTPQEIIDKPNAKKLIVAKGKILFSNISFGYDDDSNVFKDLTINIKAGEKIGLVGHSGIGKSTLTSLLLKNFNITKGDILIDDQSIYDVSSDSLRSQIALIPQDTLLFHRTIGENIGYAKNNATQEEIIEASKKAHIHEFIVTLKDGYKTLVGERGIKLSGGQRQRIAIARAILKDSPILILDEATSSLDSKTEKIIQESLNLLIEDKSKTVIAIAHRLSTLKHMDRIIVLDKGRIAEEGTHDKLLKKKNGIYWDLWERQIK